MGWLLKAIPGLGALSGFFNPWVIVSIMSSFVAGVGYEAWQATKRDVTREAIQEGALKLHAYKVAERVAADKQRKEAGDAQAKSELAELRNYLDGAPERERLLMAGFKARSGGGAVPAVARAAAGSPGKSLCFEGDRLAAGVGRADGVLVERLAGSLGRLQERALPSVQRSAAESIIAGVCSRWAVGEKP
jgi:hypothetical protein